MAKEKFSAKKIDFSNINGGYRYENGDAISADAINAPIEAVGLVQSLGETQPDNTEADKEGVASVSIVTDNNGFPKFKFSNLKGKTGAKIVSTELIGQDENGGNIYKQTFDNGSTATFVAPRGGSPTLDQLNKKLDKVTATNSRLRVYAIDTDGTQTVIPTGMPATVDTIPRRGSDGNFNVNCNNPLSEERCANLKWVKNYVANNSGGGGLSHTATLIFTENYGSLGQKFFYRSDLLGKYLIVGYVNFEDNTSWSPHTFHCNGLVCYTVDIDSYSCYIEDTAPIFAFEGVDGYHREATIKITLQGDGIDAVYVNLSVAGKTVNFLRPYSFELLVFKC